MGLDGLSALSGLSGYISGALAPSFSVNGDSQANVAEYGDGYAEFAASVATAYALHPRVPKVLPLSSGTVLVGWIEEYPATDNSAKFLVVRARVNGVWGKAVAVASIAPPFTSPNGHTEYAINEWSMGQLANGTIVVAWSRVTNGSNTAGTWYDHLGNTPAQTQGVWGFLQQLTESNGVLTLGTLTDITSSLIMLDDRNNMAVASPLINNAGVYRMTVSGNTDAMGVGNYYRVRLAGFGGTNAATLNYSTGLKAIYCKCVVAGTLDMVQFADGSATPAYSAGTTVSAATAAPEMAWFQISGGGCRLTGGAHSGDLAFSGYARWGANADGTATGFSFRTSDGVAATISTQTTANTALAEVEPDLCESSPGQLVMLMRPQSGNQKLKKFSTDAQTWATQASDSTLLGSTSLDGVCNAGGSTVISIRAGNTAARTRLTASVSKDGAVTWPNSRVLHWGTSAYSHVANGNDGKVHIVFERDTPDDSFSGGPGRIGYIQTNLAALQQTGTHRVRYFFNELASGATAWTNAAAIRDWGDSATGVCFNHNAVVKGAPVYAAGGLTFGTSDYAILANGGQSEDFYDPDHLAADNGQFSLVIAFSIASSGTGVLIGGNSAVGSATKGWKLVVNGSGNLVFTADDGTHTVQTVTGSQVVNDGSVYYVKLLYAVGTSMGFTTYDSSGNQLEGVAYGGAWSIVAAAGAISNITTDKCLLQYGNTGTGRMSQNCTIRYWDFLRGSTAISLPTLPLAPPTADTFAAAPANSPGDTSIVPANKQLFWVGRMDSSYGNRPRNLGYRNPDSAFDGMPWLGTIEQVNGYFSGATNELRAKRITDPTYGLYWNFSGGPGFNTFDSRTKNASFDSIANFTSDFTIFFKKFRVPTGNPNTTATPLIINEDATRGFQVYYVGNNSIGHLHLETKNVAGTNSFVWDQNQSFSVNNPYSVGTFYCYALTFTLASGGANGAGLVGYRVPLTGSALSHTDFENASNIATGCHADSGSTTASSGSTTAALSLGDPTNVNALWYDGYAPMICLKALSTTELALLANGVW